MEGHFKVLLQDQNPNPFFNLAMEEYFLSKMLKEIVDFSFFIIYINESAVVCGKNQSIWAEANLQFCRENGIEVAKRLSGGGTVYHDSGNLNFCFITPRKKEWVSNFSVFNSPIISYLKKLGVNASENERHDILIDGSKISGNAQHLSKNLLVSHATLLFDADLKSVSAALKHPYLSVDSRAIDSKRVPVTNISQYLEQVMSPKQFAEELFRSIVGGFQEIERISLTEQDKKEINKLAKEKFESESWVYGQSPDTTIKIEFEDSQISIKLHKGICTEVTANDRIVNLELLSKFLSGNIFSRTSLEKTLAGEYLPEEKSYLQSFLNQSGL